MAISLDYLRQLESEVEPEHGRIQFVVLDPRFVPTFPTDEGRLLMYSLPYKLTDDPSADIESAMERAKAAAIKHAAVRWTEDAK
jgi:hypothetical protein